VQAKSIRLTINSNWTNFGPLVPQTGLSEVRFLSIPVFAREPSPAAYAENVPVDSSLTWREGRQAVSNKVYMSTDRAAVVAGTAPATTTTERSFQPSALDFGQNYYWKVDEVNDTAPTPVWAGDLWAFTTSEWAPIDDFESYNNESPNRVFQTWIDGWGFSKDDNFPQGNAGNGTGALVGYDPSVGTIMETSIVHGGSQAMPVEYNNVSSPFYSEVERTWDSGQNWTGNGATELSLSFRGNPAQFTQTTDGHMVVSAYGGDIWGSADYFCFAYKKLSGDGTITAKVNSQTYAADWSKAGVMIRESLDPSSTQTIMAVTPSGIRAFQNRPTTGGASFSAHSAASQATLPFWVRLEKKGNQITAYYSADGKTFTKQPDTENTGADKSANPVTINMTGTVYVGLAVSSNTGSTSACIADFSDVTTSSSVTGTWTAADIGGANPANGPDQMYVTITDTAGKSKTIVHPDAKATCLADWTQWAIAFKDLSPVNMASVKKMVIGVGSRSTPKGGVAGMLYIDDIQYGRPIAPVGLVAYYKCEGDTKDSSGNGHDGVLAGNATYPIAYVNGPTGFGKGLLFEGTQGHQYVDLGTFNPSEKTGKLSVALWAKWDGLSTAWQGLVGKRTDVWDRTHMMWQIEANQTDGSLRFQREGLDVVLQSTAPAVGQWVHIAVTFDGTTAIGYINGVRAVSAAFSFGTGRDAPIQFGADTFGGGNAYNGALDEVRMYDVVLTPAEVAALAGK
jgi:regulation of enolase protein 1 (concanavalin A-like superfamily)